MSVNKAIIVGRLGADPEMRHAGDNPVCRLSIATDRKYTKKDGEKVEETEWHRVTVWGKQAESCNSYLAKGRQVYIEGRLHTSSYDKDGVKTYSTEIVADRVQFLGGRGDSEGGGSGSSGQSPTPYDGGDYAPGPTPAGTEDDIPF